MVDFTVNAYQATGFKSVAGLKPNRLHLNGERVPLDSIKLPANLKRAAFGGVGKFKDAASDSFMREQFFNGEIRRYRIDIPGAGQIDGPFQITDLEFVGEENGEVLYGVSLESCGELTSTAPLSGDN